MLNRFQTGAARVREGFAAGGWKFPRLLHAAGGVALEIVVDALAPPIGCDHDMDMVRTHVERVQPPAAMPADLFDRAMHDQSLRRFQFHRRMPEQFEFAALPFLVRLQRRCEPFVVFTIDRAAGIAVQPGAVAGERDEVGLRLDFRLRKRAAGSLPVGIEQDAARRLPSSRDREGAVFLRRLNPDRSLTVAARWVVDLRDDRRPDEAAGRIGRRARLAADAHHRANRVGHRRAAAAE